MNKLDTKTRQKQILEVSLELIKKGGIQNLTMKRISRNIGISEQAIYRHFNSKLDILAAIISYFNDHFAEIFHKVRLIPDIPERLEKFIESHLEYFEANPATAAVIFSEEIFQNDSTLAQKVRELVERRIRELTAMMEQGQKEGVITKSYPPEDLAYILLGALRFLVTTWRLSDFSFSLKTKGISLKKSLLGIVKA